MRPIVCSDRETWLAERRKSVGASDAAAILGLSPWRTPLDVYLDKLGVAPDGEGSEAMEWGLRLEEPIAAKFTEETGLALWDPGRYALYRHPAGLPMHATPDRVIGPAPVKGLVEIKTAGAHGADDWADGAPLQYQVQVQHQLAVLGLEVGYLAVLIGGQKFRWVRLERHRDFVAALEAQVAAFWSRVERREAPDPTARDWRALDLLYPQEQRGLEVALPGEAVDLIAERAAAQAARSEAQARWDGANNRLRALMADAERGVAPDGSIVTCRLVHRAEHVVPATEYRDLRVKVC